MSKELEALKELEKVIDEITISNADLRNTLKTSILIATIEQGLTRLEQIDNANPSEALEDFKIIKFKTINAGYDYGYEVWDKIEQALINFNNITKQINDTNGKSAICLLNKIKDKLNDYTYNNILEALLKTQSLERENDVLEKKSKEQEKVLESIKNKIIWVENDKLMCGRYADIEIELEEDDFENREEFELLKRYFGNK